MEPVTPQLVGKVRGAQRNVKYGNTDAGKDLMEAGRQVQKFGGMIGEGLTLLANLADKENRELYDSTILEFERREAELRVQLQRDCRGANAPGAYSRYKEEVAALREECRSKVSQKYQHQFDTHTGRRINVSSMEMFRFEDGEVTRSHVNTQKGLLQQSRADAINAQNAEDYSVYVHNAIDAYSRLYAVQNGGVRYTSESVNAFENDLYDGDDKIIIPAKTLPDGTTVDQRVLTIVDKYEGKPGTIGRDTLEKRLALMKEQAAAYEAGKRAVCDDTLVKRTNALLKEGRVDEARTFFNDAVDSDIPYSDGVLSELDKVITKNEEVAADDAYLTEIAASFSGAGGAYGDSAAQFTLREKTHEQIDAKYPGPENRKRRELMHRRADAKFDYIQKMQELRLAVDVNAAFADWSKSGKPLAECEKEVAKMPDSPLKTELTSMLEKQRKIAEARLEQDPKYRYLSQQNGQALLWAYSTGKLNGKDLPADPKERADMVLTEARRCGLLPKDMAFLVEAMGFTDRGVPMEIAAEELRRLTGFKSTREAMAAFPGFYDYMWNQWKAKPPQDPRHYADWLRLTLTNFIVERTGTTNYGLVIDYFKEKVYPYEMGQVFDPMKPPAWAKGVTSAYANFRAQHAIREYFEAKQRDDDED